MLLHSRKSHAVVDASNHFGDSVIAFHEPLGIEMERESFAATPWPEALRNKDRLISAGKEIGKTIVGVVVAVVVAVVMFVLAVAGQKAVKDKTDDET